MWVMHLQADATNLSMQHKMTGKLNQLVLHSSTNTDGDGTNY